MSSFAPSMIEKKEKHVKRRPQGGKPRNKQENRPGNKPGKKGQKKSTLDPNLLIQKSEFTAEEKVQIDEQFASMNLHDALKKNIAAMGFVSPTEIQHKTLETVLEGSNLIGIANTGTGKTAAFLIPIIEKIERDRTEKVKTLIIVPTRELALQIYDEFKKLSQNLKLTAACFIGGTNIDKDVRSLNNHFDFVIGTPGRLLDLKNRLKLKMSTFNTLVLDEFDKMLDMGFIRDIRFLVESMSNRKQTLLFSATRDPKQQKIIDEIIEDPVVVQVSSGDQSSKNVDQDIIKVAEGQDKFELLLNLIADNTYEKIILFTETKHLANRIAKKLNNSGVKADQIHGNKSQNYRINALDKFKKGQIRVLVATDVAARGIDVSDVSLVINYQMPLDYDTYIHRVGRTGRAGKTGAAYTFVD